MQPLHDCLLYTFVDTACLRGRDPKTVTRALVQGGSDLIQLRAKNASPTQVLSLAEGILPITAAAGVRLVINDHPQIAAAVGAPICHLGQEDFFDAGHRQVAELREQYRANARAMPLLFGLSTHAPAQAERAVAAGADYVAIGPVFATATKPTAQPVTLEYVRWAAQHISIPWFAIGGITVDNLEQVIVAGASRVCVVSAILNAPDIAQACQHFKDRLLSARRGRT